MGKLNCWDDHAIISLVISKVKYSSLLKIPETEFFNNLDFASSQAKIGLMLTKFTRDG